MYCCDKHLNVFILEGQIRTFNRHKVTYGMEYPQESAFCVHFFYVIHKIIRKYYSRL